MGSLPLLLLRQLLFVPRVCLRGPRWISPSNPAFRPSPLPLWSSWCRAQMEAEAPFCEAFPFTTGTPPLFLITSLSRGFLGAPPFPHLPLLFFPRSLFPLSSFSHLVFRCPVAVCSHLVGLGRSYMARGCSCQGVSPICPTGACVAPDTMGIG